MLRPARWGPFDSGAIQITEALVPHGVRGLALHRRFAIVDRELRLTVDTMESLPFGVVLVDAHGKALFTNREARRIVELHDGLSLTRDGLSASTATTASLRNTISEAVKTNRGGGFSSGGSCLIGRPSAKRSFSVLVAPMPPDSAFSPQSRACAAVFVCQRRTDRRRAQQGGRAARRRPAGLSRGRC